MSSLLEHQKFYHLIDLIKAIPNDSLNCFDNWNYNALAENPNIKLNDILENPELIKEYTIYTTLSYNPNLTFDFVLNNLTLKFDWCDLSINDNISFEQIKSHPQLSWSYRHVSSREDVDINFVRQNLEFKWDWEFLSTKQNIKVIELNPDLPWNMFSLSNNRTLTFEFIQKHPEIPIFPYHYSLSMNIQEIDKMIINNMEVNYDELSLNQTLTSTFILKHSDKPWVFERLSNNDNLDFDLLVGLSEDWNWEELAKNYKLTRKFLLYHINHFNTDEQWTEIYKNSIVSLTDLDLYPILFRGYKLLSYHPKLTSEYIRNHGSLDQWCPFGLSFNAGLKIKDFESLMQLGLNLSFVAMSDSPNLSYEFIYKYRHKNWDWVSLSKNKFFWENRRIQIINKMKGNYLNKKRNLTHGFLGRFVIKDLNNIVMEY